MLAAPALAELTDVAGLVGRVDRTAPIDDRDPAAPARGERREAGLLAGRDPGIAGIAEGIENKALAAAGGVKAREHRLEIADHPLRQLVADAQHDRRRDRHRLVAADARRHRHDRGDRIGGKTQDQKPYHGVPESHHHPGQRHREQHQQRNVDRVEATRRQRQRGKRQRCRHGQGEQDNEKHPPADNIVSGGVGLYGLRWGTF
jgi:hypothetical protein